MSLHKKFTKNVQNKLKKCTIESWFIFLLRKVYILWIQKCKKVCHRTTFFSIFNIWVHVESPK